MALTAAKFLKNSTEFLQSNKRIVLAYSGGLDSSVLLYLLSKVVESERLLVWHVNHQLQSFANEMETFCIQQADHFDVPFKLSRLDLSHISNNIEAQARDARYAEFTNELSTTKDILLTAHHADDQLETLILNICRGTGVNGLRGIANKILLNDLKCYRPLLNFSQIELEEFAKHHGIKWINDPSNDSNNFDRNYVRHEITPHFKKRWPTVVQSFSQVAAHQQEAALCLSELAQIDCSFCEKNSQFSTYKTLSIKVLKGLSFARQKNLLRHWFLINDFSMSLKQFSEFLVLIHDYVSGYKKIESKHKTVAFFNGELFLVINAALLEEKNVLTWLKNQEGQYVCRYNREEKKVTSHFLKRQFQAAGVPPWLRNQTLFKLNSNKSKHNLEMIVL